MTTARERAHKEAQRIASGFSPLRVDPAANRAIVGAADAASDAWEPELRKAHDLLREVLASPTSHRGVRAERTESGVVVHRYEARRLNRELLGRIKEALDGNG